MPARHRLMMMSHNLINLGLAMPDKIPGSSESEFVCHSTRSANKALKELPRAKQKPPTLAA